LPGLYDKLTEWGALLRRDPAEARGGALLTAVALAAAGVVPPILVTLFPAARTMIGPPFPVDVLLALLVLAPASVGLTVALSGLPGLSAALVREAAAEAEQTTLRVFAVTLVFAGTFLFIATIPRETSVALMMPVAAIGLAAAWGLLLWLILQPVGVPARWRLGMALDVALLSAFLHIGGSAAAGLCVLFPAVVFYAGYRFGERALIETAIASLLGFAAVVLTTGFWRQQPGLALGLGAALLVLPGCFAGALRVAEAARRKAAQAEEGKDRSLAAIADALRSPLLMLRSGAPKVAPRMLAEQIDIALDLLAMETGQFAVATEAFDLRALVSEALGGLGFRAAEKGIGLRWRIDPRLPLRLQGAPQALARILTSLVGHLLEITAAGGLRVSFDQIDRATDRVRLRLRIDARGAPVGPEVTGAALGAEDSTAVAWEQEALTVGLVRRLVTLIGGELGIEGGPGPPCRFEVMVRLAAEPRAPEADLDLRGQQVLIVGADEAFARELVSLLRRWQAEARWLGDTGTAVAEVAALNGETRAALIVDGRDHALAALAFADNVKRLGAAAPFVLFIGENSRVDRLAELDEDALDCLLPMPLNERLLANAFRGLPLAGYESHAPGETITDRDLRVTPIAAHPKFTGDTAPVVDMRSVESLRALGGEDFLRELIDTFRADTVLVRERLERAVADGDVAAFGRGLAALRRCAGHLGGTHFCHQLPSGLGEAELRQHGELHLQRIASEIDRLVTALMNLPALEDHSVA
jgi:signal transduction histidine kinase